MNRIRALSAAVLAAGLLAACSSTVTPGHTAATSGPPTMATTSAPPLGTDPAVYSAKLSDLASALGDVSTESSAGDEAAAQAACASGVSIVHEMQSMPWPTGADGSGADSMKSALSILDEGFNACTLGDWDTTSADITSATAYLTAATDALGN